MSTRNIAPDADGEGKIGTENKSWLKGFFKSLRLSNGASAGKVLKSADAEGNAYWGDPSEATTVKITDGAGEGKLLKSSADGTGSWTNTISVNGFKFTNSPAAEKVLKSSDTEGNAYWGDPSEASSLKITTGAGDGKLLKSSADGTGSWTDSISVAGLKLSTGAANGYYLKSGADGTASWTDQVAATSLTITTGADSKKLLQSDGSGVASWTNQIENVSHKNYREAVCAHGSISGSNEINLGNGNVFTATITGATTFSFAGASAGDHYSFALYLTNGGSATITWPASVKWPSATVPTLTSSGLDILYFTTINQGTTWYGFVQKDLR